jgi:hypothetical protein
MQHALEQQAPLKDRQARNLAEGNGKCTGAVERKLNPLCASVTPGDFPGAEPDIVKTIPA